MGFEKRILFFFKFPRKTDDFLVRLQFDVEEKEKRQSVGKFKNVIRN